LTGELAFAWPAAFAVGCGAALVLTPLARRVAMRAGIIDRPVGLKIHTLPTPLMGGVAVYLAFALATLLVLPLSPPVVGLLVGGLAAVVVGVLDERFNLPVSLHAAGQVAVAFFTVVAGVGIVHTVSNPLGGLAAPGIRLPAVIGLIVTLLWLVGMMNTVNFLDGLDGLAAGITCLAAILLAVWAAEPQRFLLTGNPHHEDLLLPLALAGALVGFLPYNWHVARIFLGDSGSMFLGLALGALSIVGPAKLATALLVLLVPVLDVAWAIVRRQLSGRSFLAGDKQHVYHRMLQLDMRYITVVLMMYFLCFSLAALDLLLVKLAKLIAFIVLAIAIGAAFVLLELRASRDKAAESPADVAARLRQAQK